MQLKEDAVAVSYVASADKAEAVVNELKAKGAQARAFKAACWPRLSI
jgi:hypothetical protein